MQIKKLNEELNKYIVSEGILDDVKDKVKGIFNKKPINYTYNATGEVAFDLARYEQEIDGYYLTQHEILKGGAEQPLYDVDQDVVDKATANLKTESEDLVTYLDDDLAKVIKKIEFVKFDIEDGDDKFEHYWNIEAKKELTPEQITELQSWLDGQMSDGLGEGFEQRGYDSTTYIEDTIYIKNPEWLDWNEEENDGTDDEPEEEIEIDLNDDFDINVYFHLYNGSRFESNLYKAN